MRLYLSSFGIGAHSDRLLQLAGTGRKLALIPNALDHSQDAARRAAGLQRDLDELQAIGFTPTEVDLRRPGAAERLAGFDVVWVRGGNTFVLRRALANSAADVVLTRLIREDAVVYGSYSAGGCVLAPDLHGLERVDDPDAVAEPIWNGLDILDRPFVPHVQSPGHPETADSDELTAAYRAAGRAHWALRDGDVLVVEANRTVLLATHAGSGSPHSGEVRVKPE